MQFQSYPYEPRNLMKEIGINYFV